MLGEDWIVECSCGRVITLEECDTKEDGFEYLFFCPFCHVLVATDSDI